MIGLGYRMSVRPGSPVDTTAQSASPHDNAVDYFIYSFIHQNVH